jgi:hypothetical protein
MRLRRYRLARDLTEPLEEIAPGLEIDCSQRSLVNQRAELCPPQCLALLFRVSRGQNGPDPSADDRPRGHGALRCQPW